MPTDTTYNLTELARLADVTPRTVRYYISQGLLPSPGAGPGARYGDVHLGRLRLIRRLQRENLPLADIRRRLRELPAETIAEASSAPPDSAADYIRRLLGRPSAVAAVPAPAAPAASVARLKEAPAPAMAASMPPEPDRSTWERHTLAPDVELHVRRPLDRHTSRQIDRLIRIARELLADER